MGVASRIPSESPLPDRQAAPPELLQPSVTSRFQVLRGAIEAVWMAEFEQRCRAWFSTIKTRLADAQDVLAHPQLIMIARQSGIPLTLSTEQTRPPAGLVEEFFANVRKVSAWKNVAAGRPLYLLRDYCSVRLQAPNENMKALGWHQDSAVVGGITYRGSGIYGIGTSGYVAWVPITPIDGLTPSLQFIPNWFWPAEHRSNPDNAYLEAVVPPNGSIVTVDKLDRGDIFLFDLDIPHRTYVAPGMTKERLSIDLRLVRERPESYGGEMIALA